MNFIVSFKRRWEEMKIKKIIKEKLPAFILGTLVMGVTGVVALSGSAVVYDSTVSGRPGYVSAALDDLYNRWPVVTINGVTGHVSYLYSKATIAAGAKPANGSNINAYNNGSYYIRTAVIDGTAVEHNACLKYNNREFCMAPNYWAGTIGTSDATAGAQTKIKLQRDIEAALGTSADSCDSSSSRARCIFGSAYCVARSNGSVSCGAGSGYADVYSDGSAYVYVG